MNFIQSLAMNQTLVAKNKNSLLHWFKHNQRPLPWRKYHDPYVIWISETMLQQTTTTAVIPYFEKFLSRFPTLHKLAQADLADVLQLWSGLGYYSRARNLHHAAQKLAALKTFPQSYTELLEFPGFGPYTARAVSSIAFNENVGVIDGNVIRVLSRFHQLDWDWWQNKFRIRYQQIADQWVENVSSRIMNQALMELGATICVPQNPACLLCPLAKDCQAQKYGQQSQLPKAKPRRAKEIWLWQPTIVEKNGRIAFAKNDSLPFLRGQLLLPGTGKLLKSPPKKFDFRHSITHHDIFVQIQPAPKRFLPKNSSLKWIAKNSIARIVPASLISKTIAKQKEP